MMSGDRWEVASVPVAEFESFRCRCPTRCSFRATQEDLLCDTCRKRGHAHVYIDGEVAGVTGECTFLLSSP